MSSKISGEDIKSFARGKPECYIVIFSHNCIHCIRMMKHLAAQKGLPGEEQFGGDSQQFANYVANAYEQGYPELLKFADIENLRQSERAKIQGVPEVRRYRNGHKSKADVQALYRFLGLPRAREL